LALIEALKGITADNTATDGPRSTGSTSTSTTITKLTTASARAMMNTAKEAAGYTGGFSNEDVQAFIKEFNDAQAKQVERIVTIANSKTTPGATAEAKKKILETTAREEYPSFFKPVEFASDYVWNKVNFGQEASLSGKNLGVLAQVRGVVKDFQILGYSDAEALAAAKDIARGKYTVADFTTKVQRLAIQEYPQFAERFKTDPTLTVKKIAQPIINMLAETWEVDADTIDMKNPIVASWLHPGGADGKQPPISYNEAYQRALNDPKNELTKRANESARDAAVGLASAFGFGV
jgi:hypothetical protein